MQSAQLRGRAPEDAGLPTEFRSKSSGTTRIRENGLKTNNKFRQPPRRSPFRAPHRSARRPLARRLKGGPRPGRARVRASGRGTSVSGKNSARFAPAEPGSKPPPSRAAPRGAYAAGRVAYAGTGHGAPVFCFVKSGFWPLVTVAVHPSRVLPGHPQ